MRRIDPTPVRRVVIARFQDPHSAHMARGLLEAEGIEAFVLDEHTVGIHWLFSNAIGGVRLEVRAEDAGKAAEILGEDRSWDAELAGSDSVGSEGGTRCPRCGSDQLRTNDAVRRRAWALTGLLGLPHLFQRKRWSCEVCGHSWK